MTGQQSKASAKTRIDVKQLTDFAIEVLQARGVAKKDAATVAECLVFANRSGVDSHGVVRLAHYIRRLEQGSIKAQPELQFHSRGGGIGYVDGDDGLGHVVGQFATEQALSLAADNGIAAVSVGNSSHFGMAAYYTLQMAERGFIGVCLSPTDKLLVPFGARQPFFGSNPICFAFPTNGQPVVLDMATTSIPYGKVALAAVEGESIPSDWAVDADGQPTTDPGSAVGLHPAAGPKGSGLALVVEVFGSLLASMPWGPHINAMYGDLSKPRKLGHFFMALDVSRFLPLTTFQKMLDDLIGELTALQPADGFERVCFPGQIEAETRTRRDQSGVPLGEGLIAELNALSVDAGRLT